MNQSINPYVLDISTAGNECQVTPVIHVLQYPGCVPKPIPSFACIGRCSSYLQVISSDASNQQQNEIKFLILFKRFRVAKSGKWNGLACVVKNLVNGRHPFLCSVRKPNRVNENFER